MSSHEKALEKAKKRSAKKETGGRLDEKGRKPRKEFGAKNNDSQED